MKISEALALGRTMIEPLAGTHLTVDKTMGCAWGMVNIAAPSAYAHMNGVACKTYVDIPCSCRYGHTGGMVWAHVDRKPSISYAVVHLFNDHVMTRKDWTMEQLIDWIASVEPREPETKETEEECTENRALVAHS